MKKIFFLILMCTSFFTHSLGINASEILKENFYENGSIESRKTKEKDNIKIIYYFQNGNILKEESYKSDEETKEGTFKVYHENGTLLSEEYYENGYLANGKTAVYYNIYGMPLKEIKVENNYTTVKEYFSAKQNERLTLLSERHFFNGVIDGVCRYYNSNGEEIIYHEYKNGELNGTTRLHDKIIGAEWEIEYKNDKKNGVEKIFLGDELIKTLVFENGVVVSESVNKSEKGFEFLRENYFPDVPLEEKENFYLRARIGEGISIVIGQYNIFTEDDGLTKIILKLTGPRTDILLTYYETGQFEREIHSRTYPGEPEKKEKIEYKKEYHKNGQTKYECLDGKEISYYENGQIQLEEILKRGKVIKSIGYYPNGIMKYKTEKNVIYKYHENGVFDKSRNVKEHDNPVENAIFMILLFSLLGITLIGYSTIKKISKSTYFPEKERKIRKRIILGIMVVIYIIIFKTLVQIF